MPECAIARFRRAGVGVFDREGAVRIALGPRDQVRRLPRPGPPGQRGGQDLHPPRTRWTNRFKKVSHDARHIKAASAVIDGEIVVPAADGTTDFSVLQNELRGYSTKIAMVAFGLLYPNGRDLRKLPLHTRKAKLKKIIAGTDIQVSESFEIDSQAMFEHACKVALEGVVSKVRDSAYPTGRSNWLRRRAHSVKR